ncbi:MAG TPA: ABC transporter substrate-binding protein [Acidobacteriaceae bacterium]|nr:ABC transporter substrate-binding protein [Acidobacteriaceae bacterium]
MRIASLQPSVSLVLAALDRLGCLCAVTKYCCDAVPELAGRALPVLSDSWSFDRSDPAGAGNIALLLASRPDLVIASVPYRMESLAAILKCGVPVLALAPHSLADVYSDIRLIAAHAAADPEPVITHMERTIAVTRALTAHLRAEDRPRVYCEEWGKPMIHSQRWVAELVDAAGGNFLGTPGAHTTTEVVTAADPDVLLFAWCGTGDRVPLARVIEQRGWQTLRAVREGRAHVIPDEFLNTPAPTLLEGLACIAAALHPAIYTPHPRLLR